MDPDDPAGADFEVPISAIEHYSYCPRQCALIHVEQTFDENLFTIRGQIAHARVDSGASSVSAGVRARRDVPLWSDRYGLRGKSDLVEFTSGGPFPVEYKVGRIVGAHASLQLCAQALCLEEMLGTAVPKGAIFSHATRQRTPVAFTAELRERTVEVVRLIRADLCNQHVPPAPNDARCPKCSLINACLPSIVGEAARVRGHQGALFRPRTLDDEEGDA